MIANLNAMDALTGYADTAGELADADVVCVAEVFQGVCHKPTVTPSVTHSQMKNVSPGVTTSFFSSGKTRVMGKPTFSKTYIRGWREKRGLSLRALANRLEVEPGGEPFLSHVSIGRIERGEQPYSQPIIEAISTALDVPVSSLIEVDPAKDGEVIDLVRHLDERKRAEAIRYLQFLAHG